MCAKEGADAELVFSRKSGAPFGFYADAEMDRSPTTLSFSCLVRLGLSCWLLAALLTRSRQLASCSLAPAALPHSGLDGKVISNNNKKRQVVNLGKVGEKLRIVSLIFSFSVIPLE